MLKKSHPEFDDVCRSETMKTCWWLMMATVDIRMNAIWMAKKIANWKRFFFCARRCTAEGRKRSLFIYSVFGAVIDWPADRKNISSGIYVDIARTSPHFNIIQQFIELSFSDTSCSQKCRSDYSEWNEKITNFGLNVVNFIQTNNMRRPNENRLQRFSYLLSWKISFFFSAVGRECFIMFCRFLDTFLLLNIIADYYTSGIHEFILSDTPKKYVTSTDFDLYSICDFHMVILPE